MTNQLPAAFHKGMKDLDKVSLSMARLGKIDLRGEPISGFLLVLKVRSETFEAKVLRTPYLFISGLGHCTLLTFYGMLSPEKKVISVIFSSFAPKPRTAHWYS